MEWRTAEWFRHDVSQICDGGVEGVLQLGVVKTEPESECAYHLHGDVAKYEEGAVWVE
jgi:hypothetical protein